MSHWDFGEESGHFFIEPLDILLAVSRSTCPVLRKSQLRRLGNLDIKSILTSPDRRNNIQFGSPGIHACYFELGIFRSMIYSVSQIKPRWRDWERTGNRGHVFLAGLVLSL